VTQSKAATHFAAEAVADTSDALGTQFLTNILDGGLDDGVDLGRLVLGEPVGQIGLSGLHVGNADGVAAEEVGENTEVAIGGELIGEQLSVDVHAEDVAQDDDGLFGGLVVLGVDDVGVD
jgi:hypothetical protein